MRRFMTALLLLPALATGDAGILGSVAGGPFVLTGMDPGIEMLAEDVLISVDRSKYEITGCFLLRSAADEGMVYMYFPVDIVTPFCPILFSSTDPGASLDRVEVTLDGEAADVYPLFVCVWDQYLADVAPWETIRDMTLPLFPDEPPAGGPVYATRIPPEGEVTGSFVNWQSKLPGIRSQSLNAAWSASFGAGDTVLLEYHVTGRMTMDYETTMSILCYPLQTGSTWAGSIGRGRVTVVPSMPGGLDAIVFAEGSMLPPAISTAPMVFEPLPEVSEHDAFGDTRLSRFSGSSFEGGFEWSFSDFEPSAVPVGWRGLFPGIGDMFVAVADSVREWQAGSARPFGWGGSYIYIYLADDAPSRLTVIDLDGIPLMESPDPDSGILAVLPFDALLHPTSREGDWAFVECSFYDFVNHVQVDSLSGWVELRSTGADGLSRPAALPML